jgi:hypothetical protein
VPVFLAKTLAAKSRYFVKKPGFSRLIENGARSQIKLTSCTNINNEAAAHISRSQVKEGNEGWEALPPDY